MINSQSQAPAKNEQTVSNQNVQERKKCRQFIKLIRRNYRQLKRVRFNRVGDTYQFRAKFRMRSLFAWGENHECAMARFMLEIYRKVYSEKYYPAAEFEAIRDRLQEHVILTYAVRELP